MKDKDIDALIKMCSDFLEKAAHYREAAARLKQLIKELKKGKRKTHTKTRVNRRRKYTSPCGQYKSFSRRSVASHQARCAACKGLREVKRDELVRECPEGPYPTVRR